MYINDEKIDLTEERDFRKPFTKSALDNLVQGIRLHNIDSIFFTGSVDDILSNEYYAERISNHCECCGEYLMPWDVLICEKCNKRLEEDYVRRVPYEVSKIQDAILMAATQVNDDVKENIRIAEETAKVVDEKLHEKFHARKSPTVEQVQDYVEKALISEGHAIVAKEYILYRAERNRTREMKADLMKVFEDLTFTDAKDSDIKRENGNIDADSSMGVMLKYGSEAAKEFNHLYLLDREASDAHKSGDIHIHDLDFYSLTETCCQIDLEKLFTGGFSTGHGYLREPESIRSYGALTAIALQSNQNDQHGGQSIPALDYFLAPGVGKSYVSNICQVLEDRFDIEDDLKAEIKSELRKHLKEMNYHMISDNGSEVVYNVLGVKGYSKEDCDIVMKKALKKTEKDTYQSMEALVHNLNSMHSRAGAQVNNVA